MAQEKGNQETQEATRASRGTRGGVSCGSAPATTQAMSEGVHGAWASGNRRVRLARREAS
jgi:hypothetical protein